MPRDVSFFQLFQQETNCGDDITQYTLMKKEDIIVTLLTQKETLSVWHESMGANRYSWSEFVKEPTVSERTAGDHRFFWIAKKKVTSVSDYFWEKFNYDVDHCDPVILLNDNKPVSLTGLMLTLSD